MTIEQKTTARHARTDLQDWYLTSLQPKLERATRDGIVASAAADALDRQLRDFLDLPHERDQAAA